MFRNNLTAALNKDIPDVAPASDTIGDVLLIKTDSDIKYSKDESNCVGRGSYGAVYKGTYQGQPVAVKVFYSGHAFEPSNRNFNSPYVVRTLGYSCSPNCIAVSEWMANGSLKSKFSILSNHYFRFPWNIRFRIATDIAEGLYYLHSHHFVHADIKSSNILLDENFRAKISDFDTTAPENTFVAGEYRGTLLMSAPEVHNGEKITPKADVFSYGLVLLEIAANSYVCSEFRFNDMFVSPKACKRREVSVERSLKRLARTCPLPEFIDLIKECTQVEPDKRPNTRSILTSLNLISTKMQEDPQKKLQHEKVIQQWKYDDANLEKITTRLTYYLKKMENIGLKVSLNTIKYSQCDFIFQMDSDENAYEILELADENKLDPKRYGRDVRISFSKYDEEKEVLPLFDKLMDTVQKKFDKTPLEPSSNPAMSMSCR